jgi:hypothetical protein
MGAAADQAKNALAGRPSTDGRADFSDFAGKFHARNFSRESGRRRILALALEQVCAIERRRTNADKDLFVIEDGLANGADFQDFGSAVR